MSNAYLIETISRAYQLTTTNPPAAAAELRATLSHLQEEEEKYWAWCEKQEAAHGPEMEWLAQELNQQECPW